MTPDMHAQIIFCFLIMYIMFIVVGLCSIHDTYTIYIIIMWTHNNYQMKRIRINIKTTENALDKTVLLRGVEYNDLRINPDKKHIGLIAQEVEFIIPKVVGENEMDNIKYISYGPLVGYEDT